MEILFLILILVAVVAVIAAYAGLLGAINEHCRHTYAYIPIDGVKSALMAGAWALLIFAWFAFHQHAMGTTDFCSTPLAKGIAALAAGIGIFVAIFIRIAWKTTPRVATASLAALALNGLIIVAAVTALVLWVILKEDQRNSRKY